MDDEKYSILQKNAIEKMKGFINKETTLTYDKDMKLAGIYVR